MSIAQSSLRKADAEWTRSTPKPGAFHVVVALGISVLLLSSADLVGWYFHIPLLTSAFPHYATMKPNTALCLFCLAVTALVRREREGASNEHLRLIVGDIAAGLTFVVSGLSLLEYLTRSSMGIDQVLMTVSPERFGDPAGRMSISTALCLALTSLTFLLLDRFPRLSTAFVLLATVLPVSGLVGFMFQAGPLQNVRWFRSLAVHTALCLLILQLAALALRPGREPYWGMATIRYKMGHLVSRE